MCGRLGGWIAELVLGPAGGEQIRRPRGMGVRVDSAPQREGVWVRLLQCLHLGPTAPRLRSISDYATRMFSPDDTKVRDLLTKLRS